MIVLNSTLKIFNINIKHISTFSINNHVNPLHSYIISDTIFNNSLRHI